MFLAGLHALVFGFVSCLPSLLIWRVVVLVLHFFQEGVLLRFVHDRVSRQAVVSQPLLTALDDLPTKPRNRKRTGAANPGFGEGILVEFWGRVWDRVY